MSIIKTCHAGAGHGLPMDCGIWGMLCLKCWEGVCRLFRADQTRATPTQSGSLARPWAPIDR